MKLYTLPGAPNPTNVMLYVAEKEAFGVQMDIEQEVVNVFKGHHMQEPYLSINPFGAMPAFTTDSGEHLFESLAIIEYLEELFPEPSLWGDTPEERAVARTLQRVADVRMLAPSAGYVHATNSPLPIEPSPSLAERNLPIFRKTLAYFDQLLADGRPLLTGDRVTVADCTLQGALQFMRFRALEDLADFPHVAAWSERYRQRPAAQAVLQF